MDQDLHVYASAFFVDVFSCHKRCVVQLTDDSQPFAKPGSHFLPTSAQLHHCHPLGFLLHTQAVSGLVLTESLTEIQTPTYNYALL